MVKIYRPPISPEYIDPLNEMSQKLSFVVTHKSRHLGNPSPPQMIEALAAAYQRDPDAVLAALRDLGVVGNGRPQTD